MPTDYTYSNLIELPFWCLRQILLQLQLFFLFTSTMSHFSLELQNLICYFITFLLCTHKIFTLFIKTMMFNKRMFFINEQKKTQLVRNETECFRTLIIHESIQINERILTVMGISERIPKSVANGGIWMLQKKMTGNFAISHN